WGVCACVRVCLCLLCTYACVCVCVVYVCSAAVVICPVCISQICDGRRCASSPRTCMSVCMSVYLIDLVLHAHMHALFFKAFVALCWLLISNQSVGHCLLNHNSNTCMKPIDTTETQAPTGAHANTMAVDKSTHAGALMICIWISTQL